MADRLVVRGAREHNLKDVSLDLPRDALIVFTGLSGSGKSSLAFDTIFAEGQRRYVESLSAYARQFLGQMDKPDVDFIEGLSPAVSIDQKSTSRNPRSTVGTITEVYDYLRLLYARIGHPHCPICGEPITQADPAADRRPGPRAARGHPVPGARPGDPRSARASTSTCSPTCRPRATPGPGSTASCYPLDRAAEAEEAGEAHHRGGRRPAGGQGAGASGGSPTRSRPRSASPAAWSSSTSSTCPRTTRTASAGSPSSWPARTTHPWRSTSSSRGRSRSTRRSAPARTAPASAPARRSTPSCVVPDPAHVAGRGRDRAVGRRPEQRLLPAAARGRWPTRSASACDTPWERLPARAQKAVLHGTHRAGARPLQEPLRPRALLLPELRGRDPVPRAPARRDRERLEPGAVRGLHARGAVPDLRRHPAQARDPGRHGRPAGRSPRCARCPIGEAAKFLPGCELTDREEMIAERVLKEVNARLGFLLDVGLDYLSLDRAAGHPGRRRGAADPAGHPDRLRPGRRALRARRAVDRPAPARQPPADRDADPAARPRQHADRRRARRGHHPRRRLGGRHRPAAPASTAARSWCPGTVDELLDSPRTRSPAATCPAGGTIAVPAVRRPVAAGPRAGGRGRPRAQPAQRRRAVPARGVRRGHRGVRLGQVDAGQRHPLRRAGQPDQRRPDWCRAGTAGSPASSSWTRWSASTSRRSGAPRGPTRPPTPACSTTSASCSPRPPRRRCAATSRAGSPSTSRAAAARPAPATAPSRSR